MPAIPVHRSAVGCMRAPPKALLQDSHVSQSPHSADWAFPVPADGDGMLHACRITPEGTVSYANHLIQTNRLALERAAKHQMVMRVRSQTWSACCYGL